MKPHATQKAWDELGWRGRKEGFIQGWSVDPESETVTYFVFSDEPLPAFPSTVDGYTVLLAPLPRSIRLLRGGNDDR